MTTDPNPPAERATTATEQPNEPEVPALRRRSGSDLLRFAAFGTGIGIEIGDSDLRVTIVKVRPWEVGILGSALVPDFRSRPAGEWGTELGAFLRKAGVGHIAATVMLPRNDVIVRQVFLPGVSDRDLASAIQLQIDSLHPFPDDEIYFSFARLGKSPYVLVGISRKEIIDAYSTLFAEAGLKVASFTFSAGVMYSATRVITVPAESFIAWHQNGAVEVYGESPARAIYSAALPLEPERAISVARSELRLEYEAPVMHLSEIVPKPKLFPDNHDPSTGGLEHNVLPYATALAGACPFLSIEANLLPAERRRSSSRVRLIPTFTLAGLLVLLLIALALQSSYADAQYLALLKREIQKYEPLANRVQTLDRTIAATRARSQSLDDFKRRARLDLDSLAEFTKLIPPPGWASTMEMDRSTVQVSGEVEQAGTILGILDKSPYFDKSEFTMPISRSQSGELFRIRTQRTVPPPGLPGANRNTAAPPDPQPSPQAAKAPAAQEPSSGSTK